MKDSIATKLLSSIASDHLVILCGAGLSMALPSKIPSANQLAEICSDKYKLITGSEIPEEIRNDLGRIAEFFWERNEFRKTFLNLLVPWVEFYRNPNDGHYAIADFLVCKAVNFTVSSNFDILIKSAAQKLGVPLFYPSIEVHDPEDPSLEHNPIIKIHGCCERDKANTIWCESQVSEEPVSSRIDYFRDWLQGRLPDRDLLVIGFWTDWTYMNNLLFNCVNQAEPNSVIVVDPLDSGELRRKAPDLWEWASNENNDFIHVRESGSEFLKELRLRFSKQFYLKLLESAKAVYRDQTGTEYPYQVNINNKVEIENLYALRRDVTGTSNNDSVRVKEHDSSHELIGFCHLMLMEKEAIFQIPLFLYNNMTIRLINTPGQLLSSVKQYFSREHPAYPTADITVCVGAQDDFSPHDIVRGGSEGDIIRAGCSGEWITHQEFIERL